MLGDASIVFLVQFYIRKGHICGNFRTVQIWKNALSIVGAFFWVILSNSFDVQETSVIGVFEVHELKSGVKIKVVSFPVSLGRIFAGKLSKSGEQWVTPSRRLLHHFSHIISRLERAYLRKYWSRPNLEK